jgi:hypothetical protein
VTAWGNLADAHGRPDSGSPSRPKPRRVEAAARRTLVPVSELMLRNHQILIAAAGVCHLSRQLCCPSMGEALPSDRGGIEPNNSSSTAVCCCRERWRFAHMPSTSATQPRVGWYWRNRLRRDGSLPDANEATDR